MNLPLSDIRVLELGQVIAAPYAGLLLAELGAEVIKVERPGTGDSARDPRVTGMMGHSATWLTFNRNKRSIALDLSSSADREIFFDLLAEADVFLTNLLPGAAGRLGIDDEQLRAHNPRIVTCLISGYGARHPASDQPSFDLVHQALAGFLLINGRPEDPPARVGIPIADLASGLFAAYGILGALRQRDRTGIGDSVSISMYDSMLSLLSYQATLYLTAGVQPERMGAAHEFVVPWDAYPAADGHLVVAARSEHFWKALCRAIDLDDLTRDPRFTDNPARLRHRAELDQILAQRFGTAPTEHWMARLAAAGVPSAPVRSPGVALDDESLRSPDLVGSYPLPGVGSVRTVTNPVRYGRSSPLPFTPPPELDEFRATITTRAVGPSQKDTQ